ncbi:MAG: hypothetical protein GXO70_03380, partial [Acidobacteria bacterium]|nr:hypothetical protein [Acidobacteriota bacterium]
MLKRTAVSAPELKPGSHRAFIPLFFFLVILMFLFQFPVLAGSGRRVVLMEGNSGKAIVVRGFQVTTGVLRTSLDRKNATFLVVDGLNKEGVSFQWEQSPNYFLIVDGNQITLSYRKHSDWFKRMASFKIQENSDGISRIESVGKPGFMLTVSGSRLIPAQNEGPASSFRFRSPEQKTQPVPTKTLNRPVNDTVTRTATESANEPQEAVTVKSDKSNSGGQPRKTESG